MEDAVLRLNTVLLYVLAAALVGGLLFLLLRSHFRLRALAKRGGVTAFDRGSRATRQALAKELFFRYPALKQASQWLDERLLRARRAHVVRLELRQEWCCEDRTGQAEAPCRARPCALVFEADGEREERALCAFTGEQYLTEEENRLLCWALLSRCRALLPYRRYRTHVRRVRRAFRVENGAPVRWRSHEAVLEEYTVEII